MVGCGAGRQRRRDDIFCEHGADSLIMKRLRRDTAAARSNVFSTSRPDIVELTTRVRRQYYISATDVDGMTLQPRSFHHHKDLSLHPASHEAQMWTSQ
jgi:hypothetical protein